MAKRKKRPAQRRKAVSLPAPPERVARPVTRGDMGPDTPLQGLGKVVEPVTFVDEDGKLKTSPNGMRRARRIDIIESYHRRDRNPILDATQFKAAKMLREAYEATKKGPPAIKEIQVDASPKPDHFIDVTIDRLSRFSAIMRHVPQDCRDVVDAVVLENQSIGWLKQYRNSSHPKGVERLQRGLDMVAEALQL
jgi:hypothetical protein